MLNQVAPERNGIRNKVLRFRIVSSKVDNVRREISIICASLRSYFFFLALFVSRRFNAMAKRVEVSYLLRTSRVKSTMESRIRFYRIR